MTEVRPSSNAMVASTTTDDRSEYSAAIYLASTHPEIKIAYDIHRSLAIERRRTSDGQPFVRMDVRITARLALICASRQVVS